MNNLGNQFGEHLDLTEMAAIFKFNVFDSRDLACYVSLLFNGHQWIIFAGCFESEKSANGQKSERVRGGVHSRQVRANDFHHVQY